MTNLGSVYFNEFDDATASWLLRLAASGNLNYTEFKVDRRSVVDVRPADLTGYTECNFFAGIGGWRRALHLAGVDVHGLCNRIGGQLWTASLPCQPFSIAGKGRGVEDERHLWPVFRELVSECKPAIIFGEQVASRAGREWLSGVRSDLEALGYAVGAADLCAACVGAPHIRQRLYWFSIRRDISERLGDSYGRQFFGRSTQERAESINAYPSDSIQLSMGYWSEYSVIPVGNDFHTPEIKRFPPTSSVLYLLANGLPAGMGASSNQNLQTNSPLSEERKLMRLRGYGNAIVPQLAVVFIRSALSTLPEDMRKLDSP